MATVMAMVTVTAMVTAMAADMAVTEKKNMEKQPKPGLKENNLLRKGNK